MKAIDNKELILSLEELEKERDWMCSELSNIVWSISRKTTY